MTEQEFVALRNENINLRLENAALQAKVTELLDKLYHARREIEAEALKEGDLEAAWERMQAMPNKQERGNVI